MPTAMATGAIEKSTYAIPFTFRDDAGVAVVPSAATWTLLKKVANADTIVRGPVTITPLTSTHTIVLTGTDLAIAMGEGNPKKRYILVEYTYTSSLGAGLFAKDQITFSIENLVGVT